MVVNAPDEIAPTIKCALSHATLRFMELVVPGEHEALPSVAERQRLAREAVKQELTPNDRTCLFCRERMSSASGHCNRGKRKEAKSGTRIGSRRWRKPLTTHAYADELRGPSLQRRKW